MKKMRETGILLFSAMALQAQERPNIVWISTEDISPRWGCYNDPLAQTPVIDRLAKEGICYTNVFTTAAISAPVRAGIITGMYQTSIGCHHMRTVSYMRAEPNGSSYTAVPPHYVKAFTEYLRYAGYFCTNNSKTDYQFSDFAHTPESIWDECGTFAHFRNRREADQPFFAVFNNTGTHESQAFDTTGVKTDFTKVSVPPYYVDSENTRKAIAKQYDNIAAFDAFVAKVVEQLKADGLLDNTIIFVGGDHGDGFARGKRWLYDSGTRIPLVVRFPDKYRKGEIDDRLISSIDFGPTVLSLAGVPVPSHMQGLPFLGEQDREERSEVYAARDREDESYDMVRMVRDKKFLYIRNFYPNQPYVQYVPYRNQSPIMQDLYAAYEAGQLNAIQKLWFSPVRPPEELYDVENDPHNVSNLADDPQYYEILKQMRKRQDQWGRETGDQGLINEQEMYERMWPGGIQPVTNRPYIIKNNAEERVRSHKSDKYQVWQKPGYIDFYCSTQGASIVYRINGDKKHWLLYTGPVYLEPGSYKIEVKAQRYGYKESEPLVVDLVVNSGER